MISEELQKLIDTKAAIKQALIDKGASPSDLFSSYASEIVNLPSGGGDSDEVIKGLIEGTSTEFAIPNGATTIRNYAFAYSPITKVTIPSSVTTIGMYAFYLCQDLTDITIPSSVTTISLYAFYLCTAFKNFVLPNGINSIAQSVFSYCPNLESIYIPDSVKTIGSYAFYNCAKLASINIPNSVTSIGSYAFGSCSSLTSIEIPDSVVTLENNCFDYCTNLTNIKLPNKVTELKDSLLNACKNLTNIFIPNSVNTVGNYVFSNCSKLDVINFGGIRTTIPALKGVYAFSSTPSTKKILVPDALYDEWKTKTNWSSTSNGIVTAITKFSDYYDMNVLELSVTADDCSWAETTTTLHYKVKVENTNKIDGSSYISEDEITVVSDPFELNLLDRPILRASNYNYQGVTGTVTFTLDEHRPYSINLNNQWENNLVNPDPINYYGYQSFSNRGIGNQSADLIIKINDMQSFTFYIRSDSEKFSDYIEIYEDDIKLNGYGTYSSPNANTDFSAYQKITREYSGGEHTITVRYYKNYGTNVGADRGYVLIPKNLTV